MQLPAATQDADLWSECHPSLCLLLTWGENSRCDREDSRCDPAPPSHLHEKAHAKGAWPNLKYPCENALIGNSNTGFCGMCECLQETPCSATCLHVGQSPAQLYCKHQSHKKLMHALGSTNVRKLQKVRNPWEEFPSIKSPY